MSSGVRIALGCALALLTGALLALSFAPHDLWGLAWIAFIPMVIAQHRVLPARWSRLAPALAVGAYVAGCFGGIFPPAAAWYMRYLPLLFGAALLIGPGGRARRDRGGYTLFPLQFAIGWVAIELVRSQIPVLGTWGFLGYAMYRQAWLLQPVSIFGTFGFDLLIVLVNLALALFALALLDRRYPPQGASVSLRLAGRWCGVAAVLFAAWTGASLAMRASEGPTVRVAVLQPGVRPYALGATQDDRDRSMLAVLAGQTHKAASQGARFVVWPEGALSKDPQVSYRDAIASLAKETGAYLFVGYQLWGPAGHRNEVLTVGPDGAMLGVYGKDHPVLFLGGQSVTRGTYPTYETSYGTVGAIICYDMDFTDTARKIARGGARLIAVPSADWPAIASTHYVHAVFRALETGAAFAKSEYSHDSAIVDASGRILASSVSREGTAALLVADVPLRSGGLPLATRWGDWVGWSCLVGMVVGPVVRRTRVAARGGNPVGQRTAVTGTARS